MAWYSRFRVCGLTLASVTASLLPLHDTLPSTLKLSASYLPHEACVDVYLASDPSYQGTLPLDEGHMLALSQRIEQLLGADEFIFHSHHTWLQFKDEKSLQDAHDPERGATLAHAVARMLSQEKRTIATAESLTGGLLASALTDVPGMSEHFLGGVVAYSAKAKHTMGVPHMTVALHGVVSPQTAEAMATAVKRLFGTDVGVGVTGVAGPSEHGDKPVGTVFVGVDGPNGVMVEEGGEVCMERDGRAEMKTAAVAAALNLLRRQLKSPTSSI
ncbi:CinA-domain-containing protein [Calocera cornea HHB12733]|uniref:CinA-domain-containing protein n=1 Tax=Calocera cornea HHB12733 TaxID=1353952 RepID=A0A165J2R1_9BASI|nr:CinA-domain-containing protein [Calocera cornea HHB12733]